MHFLDGNDPANVPGASLIYPEVDPNLAWDSKAQTVIDTRNGERFSLKITDKEYNSFIAGLVRPGKKTVEIVGYVGSYTKPGFGDTTAYNIEEVMTGLATDGAESIDYPVNRIAKFLNIFPTSLGKQAYAGNVVIIDNVRNKR